jgi:hypothetical protein
MSLGTTKARYSRRSVSQADARVGPASKNEATSATTGQETPHCFFLRQSGRDAEFSNGNVRM